MSAARQPGAPAADQLSTLFEAAAFHRTLGASITRSVEGVEIRAHLDGRFESIPGRLHGGIVASLLDSAGTWALIAETGEIFTTVDLRTDFLRPARLGALVATGRVVSCGSNVARASAWLLDAQQRCCATATGTFVRAGRPAPRA